MEKWRRPLPDFGNCFRFLTAGEFFPFLIVFSSSDLFVDLLASGETSEESLLKRIHKKSLE